MKFKKYDQAKYSNNCFVITYLKALHHLTIKPDQSSNEDQK